MLKAGADLPTLQTVQHPHILAAGDCALIEEWNARPLGFGQSARPNPSPTTWNALAAANRLSPGNRSAMPCNCWASPSGRARRPGCSGAAPASVPILALALETTADTTFVARVRPDAAMVDQSSNPSAAMAPWLRRRCPPILFNKPQPLPKQRTGELP